MTYEQLIREHEEIDALAAALADIVRGATAVDTASRQLERLAVMIRDHMAAEEITLSATLDAAARDRHHIAAAGAMHEVDGLREDWAEYLYRWPRDAIAADWQRFGLETAALMERVQVRVAQETGVLYSLALHYRLIAPDA